MSTALKHKLIDHEEPAYRVAMKMGISEVRLSKISSGLIVPRLNEKQSLSKILGVLEGELFPEEAQGAGGAQ